MTIDDIKRLVGEDESRTLELKKSTGEIKDGMHTACAFLNSDGGWLIFGIAPGTNKIIGQEVSDRTKQEIATALSGIEPVCKAPVSYINISPESPNQVIADMLFKSTFLERWGSGIGRITNACNKAGLTVPIWTSDGYSVTVTFKRKVSGANSGANSGAKLTDRQLAIIEIVKTNPQVSLDEIAISLGVGTTTIDREISRMKSVLKRVGPKFGGHWEILE